MNNLLFTYRNRKNCQGKRERERETLYMSPLHVINQMWMKYEIRSKKFCIK